MKPRGPALGGCCCTAGCAKHPGFRWQLIIMYQVLWVRGRRQNRDVHVGDSLKWLGAGQASLPCSPDMALQEGELGRLCGMVASGLSESLHRGPGFPGKDVEAGCPLIREAWSQQSHTQVAKPVAAQPRFKWRQHRLHLAMNRKLDNL